ncbi:MAG: GTP-sensing pleiotropic transcriptional regulator CodY [Phascolarctobacterium sp.]|nr:GTP-sensing pleiotropic transcriptional regulator CodY [Phascolarctobacterium sp.]
MELLEKTRKINSLLQNGDKVEYNAIAQLLRDIIEANTYIVGAKGEVKGYALIREFECDIMREQVLDRNTFPDDYLNFIMRVKETLANIPHENQNCSFITHTKCIFKDKMTTVVPIYGKGERIGTLIVAKYDASFDDEDLLLAEYAATVLGVEILHDREALVAEDVRKKAMVQVAFDTLSYSEMEAIVNILGELKGDEGLLVASKIADRVGITRSVIVNALRKFESAGLIETKSLGMKGTYIRVLNDLLFSELKRRTKSKR